MRKATNVMLVIFAAMLMFGWGCQEVVSDAPVAGPNLNAVYGGYDSVSEDPDDFGAEPASSTLCGVEEGSPYEDPIEDDSEYQDADNDPLARKFFLRIDWGQLRFNRDCPVVTNWDGGVSVSQGFVRILRRFAFERGDSIVRPRTDKAVVEWESNTKPHHDGLLLKIVVPANATNVTVTFATDPYETTFTLEELEKVNERVEVDEYGNMVSFIGFEKQTPDANGYLAGKWNNGLFRGKWVNADGTIKGIISGGYGVRADGKKVLFAKYVDTEGNFRGFVRGVWGYGLPGVPGGYFSGHWVDASGNLMGYIGGHWVNSPEQVGGFFRGIYTVHQPGEEDERTDEDKSAFPEL